MTDELGALRHIDDAKRAEAMALVRTGRMYDLGHELHGMSRNGQWQEMTECIDDEVVDAFTDGHWLGQH